VITDFFKPGSFQLLCKVEVPGGQELETCVSNFQLPVITDFFKPGSFQLLRKVEVPGGAGTGNLR
jgi:hypothetical protein